jgi:transposase
VPASRSRPDNLTDCDTGNLQAILARRRELAATAELVRSFAAMLTGLHGDRLDDWITTAQQTSRPGITGFAAGLSRPHRSGPIEGNVNRVKMIKRQMYGRAGFDLLRKRVLLAV